MGVTDVIRVLALHGRFRNSPNACYVRHTTPPFRLTRYELLLRPSPPVASVNNLRQSDQLPAECGHVTSFCAALTASGQCPPVSYTLRASARPPAVGQCSPRGPHTIHVLYTSFVSPRPAHHVPASPRARSTAALPARYAAAPPARCTAASPARNTAAPPAHGTTETHPRTTAVPPARTTAASHTPWGQRLPTPRSSFRPAALAKIR